jgi:response regulator RpfG family c-di-GMP phosphodiesterase
MSNSQPASVPILVVDDEELIAAALGHILRQAKYEVVTMSQPMLALDELKRREFSIVISDQRMPGLSGLELLAEARRLRPNTTRILITGVLNLDTVIDAINQGEIFRFIVKPWLREEFLATVSNAMQRYELLCQNERLQASAQAVNERLEKANTLVEEKTKVVASQNQQLTQMNKALEEISLRSLELWVHTLETFLPSLGAQARCVAQVCQALAAALDLKPAEQRSLENASLLYDIGLVALPRQLIRRWQENPDNLDPTDAELIRQHPVLSQEFAALGNGLEQAGPIIRAHHERFDGHGYPDALKGEQIPWLARLLAVAVGYACSNLPPAQTLESIKLEAGSLFDPEAVRVLLGALAITALPSKEREIAIQDLAPGMILSRGIYSHNGLLLVPEGQRLDDACIRKLAGHHHVHPITQSLAVYC